MTLNNLQPLTIQALQTRIFQDNENLFQFIIEHIPSNQITDSMVLAITSKIVSLSEGCFAQKKSLDKEKLVRKESDHYLGEIKYGCHLTIKHGLFIASAGIDESNSQTGDYILYPKDPYSTAKILHSDLKRAWDLENLGLIFTDSHTTPLRRGVTGIALAHYGFNGIRNHIGDKDLFNRPLQMTTVNIADGLASAATLLMGETNERCPLALIKNANLDFSNSTDTKELIIPVEDDLYYPIIKPLITKSSSLK